MSRLSNASCGVTQTDHETSKQVTIAARWLVEHQQSASPPNTEALRQQFGLSFSDVEKAWGEAKRIAEAVHG